MGKICIKDDIFRDDIEKAKGFCIENLNNIYVSGDYIVATSGYMAIIIKNKCIPIKHQNKIFEIDIETNKIINEREVEIEDVYHWNEVKKGIEFGLEFCKMKSENITKVKRKDFVDMFYYKDLSGSWEMFVLENHEPSDRVAFNKYYLKKALNLFEEDSTVTVFYPHYSLSPIYIENEKQLVLVLPIRVNSNNLD